MQKLTTLKEKELTANTQNKNDKKSWIINSLKPYWFTFLLKPLLKIKQFI